MPVSTEPVMRARWISEWGGTLHGGERPIPRPGPGEVLIEVEACGVGSTVLNAIAGDLAHDGKATIRVPGHEFVGRIVAVGDGVDSDRINTRVMAFFYLFCGVCRRCLAGNEPLCEDLAGFIGVDIDGGYGRYAAIPSRNAILLDESIDAVDATAIPDAIATPVHVASRTGIGPGDRVAVIGAGGGVGVHMVQVAALCGAVVVGLELDGDKRDYLQTTFGVESVDSHDFAVTRLPASWDRGADVVIDLVGRGSSLSWALESVREDGRVAVLTTFRDNATRVAPRDMVFRQVSIVASKYANRRELMLAAELVAAGRIRPVVSDRAMVDDVDRLHERLERGNLLGRAALVWNNTLTTEPHPMSQESQ